MRRWRELSVSKTIWRSWRVLDKREGSDGYSYLDDLLRERADQSLEHVFSLFAVVLPREPLMAAFRGLHEDDRTFHGLALEYLETVLPHSCGSGCGSFWKNRRRRCRLPIQPRRKRCWRRCCARTPAWN